MSLIVKLFGFKALKSKSDKFARIEFRGYPQFTQTLPQDTDFIGVEQQLYQWPVNSELVSGDTLEVYLLIHNKWGNNSLLGSYTLGMQVVATEGYIKVCDSLVNTKNRTVPAFVDMEIFYIPPKGGRIPTSYDSDEFISKLMSYVKEDGNMMTLEAAKQARAAAVAARARPTAGLSTPPVVRAGSSTSPGALMPSDIGTSKPVYSFSGEEPSTSYALPAPSTNFAIAGPSHATASRSASAPRPASAPGSQPASEQSSETEDNDLETIERHIANYERCVKSDKLRRHNSLGVEFDSSADESSPAPKGFKQASKRFLRRGFSMGGTKETRPSTPEPKRRSAFKSVRNLMKMGKQRPQPVSSGDEERVLISPRPGSSHNSDQGETYESEGRIISASSEDLNAAEPSETTQEAAAAAAALKSKQLKAAAASKDSNMTYGGSLLKAADFQVCVTIIEARQLAGLNMDPVVCVQVGDTKKYTSVKESTNCPYYNEYFVFDFHMPPVMLLDKIITISVLQSRNILRSNKLLGTFKLDVATVWSQTDRQFYHKWAVLTDPDDFGGDIKGYVKCDISVIGKGDTIKIPTKSDKDDDDIEANLLLPDGMPVERQKARFIVKIYRADGLPKMNYSILANVKRAFTGETHDLVDPYVQVSFAGMTGSTSVKKNCYSPVWNEQIVFTEMFPPLCQRIKIELRDNLAVRPTVIGTHFIDLKTISNDGDRGFLPTFGPAFVHLYGSTRDYSLLDQHANLNSGMGEGVSYRARVLVAIRTEIIDNVDSIPSEVEVEPATSIHESSYGQDEEFFLFASLFETNMIDKRIAEKPISFELSMGNAGNALDGHNESLKRSDHDKQDLENVSIETGFWRSTVRPCKPESHDKNYFFLPCYEHKPCMQVRSVWPDHRRRMFISNIISKIIDKFEQALAEAQVIVDSEVGSSMEGVMALRTALETASAACADYARQAAEILGPNGAAGNTKLDRERAKMCLRDITQIANLTRTLKSLITKHSLKDRFRTAYSYLNRLKQLCEDPQHSLPDVFLWLVSNNKRLAYVRIPARDLIYSDHVGGKGNFCGKMQTLFLKVPDVTGISQWPGKKANGPGGWSIPAKVYIYLWLGLVKDKKHFADGLPKGYEISNEIRNADNPHLNAPTSIFYAEKHNFQLRAYIYQARSLIGSDASGLSDPFARVIIGESSATTQVIDETLSPTWDELLVCYDIMLISTIEQIKKDPPTIVIEVFDQDKVGKAEFIGRAVAKPHVKAFEDPYERPIFPPSLEWHELIRGGDEAGELLAAFELLEMPGVEDNFMLPELPSPRESNGKPPIDVNKGPILPVPLGIRPTLAKYRIEVLFWGLRDLKRIHLLTVDKPRVDIECAGNIIHSSIIQNAKRNPNFTTTIKFVDVELPEQELYRPPLTIRVIDCRSFGRITLVGTHTINSIHKHMYIPMSKRERDAEDRKKSVIQLQNVDLKSPNFGQSSTKEHMDLENIPLLPRSSRSAGYGSRAKEAIPKEVPKSKYQKSRKESATSLCDEDESKKDWWTKYFASIEQMIEDEKLAKIERMGPMAAHLQAIRAEQQASDDVHFTSPRSKKSKQGNKGKVSPSTTKKPGVPVSSLTTIYPHELEANPEFNEFKEWLQSFDLYRGKKTGDDSEDENRIVGVFKGAIKVYKWPMPKEIDDHTIMGFDPNYGFFQGVPSNDPIHVLVRVYIVKATDLHPMDLNGKADPYIVLHLGSKRISDKENYVSKQLNPVFGKCFEIEATFPQDSMLLIQVLDWDLLGTDDMIGETKIDLENRFYSRHRATCGLPRKYEESGYNRWRDSSKPTQILAKLCKEGKLPAPVFSFGRVRIGRTVFDLPHELEGEKFLEEQAALMVLRRWHEVPRVGTHLVTEHVETRSLFNPNKPGIEQGRLEMWVDMFPMDMPLPGPPLDISPRKPRAFELRVIIWNTDDVVLEDDEFFTGEKMSDIYVKGWLKGPDDCQSTDIHYRSLTGEGNFNWRFVYRFEYLEAEEKIVISRKESMFSWDETECKVPARLELQVWDADHFSADDFLGSMTLDLNRFPRGAKSSQLCTLDMLRNDGSVPMVNIFKQKRVKGWWPFYTKRDSEQMELTGKVEAEIHLLTREEADKVPAGMGRNEPDPLDKPNRPDSSFMWFLNPLKSVRYIVWHNYKWTILKALIILGLAVLLLLFFYSIPGYTVKRLLGA